MEDLPGFAAPTQPAPAAPGQNESIKINEQKSTIWLQEKRYQNAQIPSKSHNFECKFVSFAPSGLVAPVPVEPQKLREHVPSTTSFTASHACQHMSTMFHQGPSSQHFISFFRQLGTCEKMGNQKVKNSMESKRFNVEFRPSSSSSLNKIDMQTLRFFDRHAALKHCSIQSMKDRSIIILFPPTFLVFFFFLFFFVLLVFLVLQKQAKPITQCFHFIISYAITKKALRIWHENRVHKCRQH